MWSKLLTLLCDIVSRWFKYKDQRDKENLRKAVVEKDKEAVNEHLNKLLILALLIIPFFTGCKSYTVIASDREVVPIVHENVSGWFVPDAVMLDIVNKLGEK
jgi:hypothetical protein